MAKSIEVGEKVVSIVSPTIKGTVTAIRPETPLMAEVKRGGRVTVPAYVEIDGHVQVHPTRVRRIKGV